METETQQAIDLNLDLTVEEIYLLTQLMEIPVLLGVDLGAVRDLPDETRRAVAATALRGLRARQFVQRNDEGRWEPKPFVAALILTAAAPERSFILLQQRPGQSPTPRYAHSFEDNTVLLYPLGEGVHRFILSQQPQPARQMAQIALDLPAVPANPAPPFAVSRDTVSQVQELVAEKQPGSAVQTLTAAGADAAAAQAFVDNLADMTAITTMTQIIYGRDSGQRQTSGFTLVDGAAGIWRLRPREEQIQIAPVSQEEALADLAAIT